MSNNTQTAVEPLGGNPFEIVHNNSYQVSCYNGSFGNYGYLAVLEILDNKRANRQIRTTRFQRVVFISPKTYMSDKAIKELTEEAEAFIASQS